MSIWAVYLAYEFLLYNYIDVNIWWTPLIVCTHNSCLVASYVGNLYIDADNWSKISIGSV